MSNNVEYLLVRLEEVPGCARALAVFRKVLHESAAELRREGWAKVSDIVIRNTVSNIYGADQREDYSRVERIFNVNIDNAKAAADRLLSRETARQQLRDRQKEEWDALRERHARERMEAGLL